MLMGSIFMPRDLIESVAEVEHDDLHPESACHTLHLKCMFTGLCYDHHLCIVNTMGMD